MDDLKKLKIKIKKILFIILIFSICFLNKTYGYWREEIEEFETQNIDSMNWLSKKRRDALKNEQEKEYKKKLLENQNKDLRIRKFKWLYDDRDITNYSRDKWELIDDDNDGKYFKYFFDSNGYLLIDTVTVDYKIVDDRGREVDENFKPIVYELKDNEEIIVDEDNSYTLPTKEQSKVLISEGAVLKNTEKIFDNKINNNLFDYIDNSNRFLKDVIKYTYSEYKWKKCCQLKSNGGYVIFKNPKNNFNKINGEIADEYTTKINTGYSILKVYDANLYDKYNEYKKLDDLEIVYQSSPYNKSDSINFSFTFDRSISRLRFEIETDGNKEKTCLMRKFKYGFSKSAYKSELERKKEAEEEKEELKRLGIYVEDIWILDNIDEDGGTENVINEEVENNSYIIEETKSYEDVVRDRKTGPSFDKDLNEKIDTQKIGPAFNNTE